MFNLVLVHGWGCDSSTWQPLLSELEKIAAVQLLDLPGFGKGSVADPFLLGPVLEQLAASIPDGAVVMGWSLGGMLAVQLAAQFPRKVGGVVTLAANAKFVASEDYPWAMSGDTSREFNESFARDPHLAMKLFYGLLARGDARERQLSKALHRQIPVAFSSQWSQALDLLREMDNRSVLASLQQPCLHIFAEKDALVPSEAALALAGLNPGHQVLTIAQAAHAMHWSSPMAVVDAVSSFLRLLAGERLPLNKKPAFDNVPRLDASPALDKKKVARSFGRAAATYDAVAQLQRDVGNHLFNSIPRQLSAALIEAGSLNVIDLGSGTGFFTQLLAARYGADAVIGLDLAEGMVRFSRQHLDPHGIRWLCADAEHLPFASDSADLIFSSLVIQWCTDLPQLMCELARTLKPGGRLAVATLGPNTLHELKAAWKCVDDYIHVNQFQPQDHLRLAAVAADLVIDHFAVEQRIIYFDRLTELTRELKSLGAHNINAGKPEGLTGRSRIAAFKAAYEQYREARGLPATYEIFYLSVHKKLSV